MTKVKNKLCITNHQLTGVPYQVKFIEINGQDFMEIPAVMMVEGVHTGSRGPIYHSINELKKSASKWKNHPVTLYHPQENGQFVSAQSEEIKSNWGIGYIADAFMEDNKLKAILHINTQKIIALSPETHQMILNSDVIEVSVGLFSQEDNVNGVWNDEIYVSSAFDYIPDHLALLPGELGACSVTDGCGIRVNKKGGKMETVDALRLLKRDEKIFPVVYERGLRETVDKVRDKLYGMDSYDSEFYLEEVYSDHFIFRMVSYEEALNVDNQRYRKFVSDNLYKRSYTVSEAGDVEFTGEPVRVVKKVDYLNVNEQKKEVEMCVKCKEKAKALIANENTLFDENDLGWLETLSEDKLDKLIPKIKVVEKEVTVNAEVTKEKALEVLGVEKTHYEKGLEYYQAKKAEIVESIITNTDKDIWTENELNAMEMDMLEKISKTIPAKTIHVNTDNGGASSKGVAPLVFGDIDETK